MPTSISCAFADLEGWGAAEADALMSGVTRHFDHDVMARPAQAPWLTDLKAAITGGPINSRAFVEAWFRPVAMRDAFFTGYYEPRIDASRTRTNTHQTPIHARPVGFERCAPQPGLPGDGTYARRTGDGSLAPLPDRGAMMDGALSGVAGVIAYASDPVDAFFAQVQGSALLVFADGTTQRIGYHGKSGHPYTPIGRVLVERGLLSAGGVTMATIRDVLARHPEQVRPVLAANQSYIYFRERSTVGTGPVAAGGVPLQPWRSVAVDRAYWGLGTPMHAALDLPDHGRFTQVAIAEDCGSAIVGAARADLFCGSGAEAGDVAGALATHGLLTAFVPRSWGQ